MPIEHTGMKDTIRKEMSNIREDLDYKETVSKSTLIKKRLLKFNDVKKSNKIGLYFSIGKEVRTKEIIETLLKDKKRICLPKIIKDKMCFVEIMSLDDLKRGKFSVMEPINRFPEIDPNELDIIFVPAVSLDKMGNRIGRGSGYYDKFLNNCNAKKIALAYDFQILDSIPSDKRDIRMDYIMTDKRLIKKKK